MTQQRPAAVITGGARRVGREIARQLAAAGFDIAFTYNNSQGEARSLVDELHARGAAGIAIQSDLTAGWDAVDRIGNAVLTAFGRVDVLVNNASIYEPGGMSDFSLPRSRRMWAIHVETPVLLCKRFENELRAARGHVVNMLDLLVEKPLASHLEYCASKAALWNLTLSLARELAPDVTVNGIAPGVVEWPADYPQAEREKYLRRVPLGRAGTPNDVARAVLFFCREAPYVTGQILRLDGGRSLV
jgi:pteridine reductase